MAWKADEVGAAFQQENAPDPLLVVVIAAKSGE